MTQPRYELRYEQCSADAPRNFNNRWKPPPELGKGVSPFSPFSPFSANWQITMICRAPSFALVIALLLGAAVRMRYEKC